MIKNKRVVYTVVFGDYDYLEEVKKISNGVKYYCITDNENISSDTWNVIYLDNISDPVTENRKYKFFPHHYFECDESIYLDANISITGDINLIFDDSLKDNDISISPHPFRDCLYDESIACISVKNIDPEIVNKQMSKYSNNGFPKNYGLFENNVIVRRHSKLITKLMNDWWDEFISYSKRDQLSLCYLMWKNNIRCYPMKYGPRYSNKFFKFRLHRHELKLPLIKKIVLISSIRRKQNFFYKAIVKMVEFFKR